MDRKFLEELGLEKEAIDKVMAAHGKAIQSVKPADDYEELKKTKAALEKQVTDLQNDLVTKESEYSTVGTTLEELKNEVETYKVKDLKTSIAIQAGIPVDLAGRLNGETEEELKADAEKLSGFISKKNPLPLKPTEPEATDKTEQAYAKMLEELD